MAYVIVHKEYCKACGYCIRDCPVKAIISSGKMNSEGYEYTQVDDDLCIKCGTCYVVCPDQVFEIVEN
ncbi:4Fe-4S binding protein [Lachnospiraceae bacterium ZAX-1]